MSETPRSVLVAVDFGGASARAVALGGRIAHSCGATLRLLHAETIEAPPYFTPEQLGALEYQRQAVRQQAEHFLSRFGRQQTTTPLAAVIDSRTPVEAILLASASADLVVMGTHGRRGPSRWWLGSVAERVLREITKPLLIVRADMSRAEESPLTRVLVHAAETVAGATALDYAHMLAKCFKGQVVDGRNDSVEAALERSAATLLVAAAPHPRSLWWLSHYGEPLARFCSVPILFVPDVIQGASS